MLTFKKNDSRSSTHFNVLIASNILSDALENISLISVITGLLHLKLIEQSLIRLPVLSL